MNSRTDMYGDQEQLTLQAVLDALRIASGNDDLSPETPFYEAFISLDFKICFLAFKWELEERLNTEFELEAWIESLWAAKTEGPRLTYVEFREICLKTATVADFAEWLSEFSQPIRFEPVSLLGSPPCPAAGYFVGMQEIAQRSFPGTERFAPSTAIRSVLSTSQLTRFWERMCRETRRELPPLHLTWIRFADGIVLLSLICLAIGVLGDWAFLAATWGLFLKLIWSSWWLRGRLEPLPRGLETFGDLARYLAR